jgi:hypothetical protein
MVFRHVRDSFPKRPQRLIIRATAHVPSQLPKHNDTIELAAQSLALHPARCPEFPVQSAHAPDLCQGLIQHVHKVLLRRSTDNFVHKLTILKQHHSRDACDSKTSSGLVIIVRVDFANLDSSGILGRQLFYCWHQMTARTAPWRPEVNQYWFSRLKDFGLEVRISKLVQITSHHTLSSLIQFVCHHNVANIFIPEFPDCLRDAVKTVSNDCVD